MQKECGTNKKNKKSCYYNFCFGIENTFGWLWKKKKKKRLSIVTTQKFYVLGDYFEFFNALVNIEWFFFYLVSIEEKERKTEEEGILCFKMWNLYMHNIHKYTHYIT